MAIFAVIVMYDAMGVRRAAGNNARIINQILKELAIKGNTMDTKALQEFIGHTPMEVVTGALVGIMMVVVVF